jgi:hypothetical protein
VVSGQRLAGDAAPCGSRERSPEVVARAASRRNQLDDRDALWVKTTRRARAAGAPRAGASRSDVARPVKNPPTTWSGMFFAASPMISMFLIHGVLGALVGDERLERHP